MNRYHFHVFDGHNYHWDAEGLVLPDLELWSQKQNRGRAVIESRSRAQEWTAWIVDVRGNDDITLFHYPFTEVTDQPDSEEQSDR